MSSRSPRRAQKGWSRCRQCGRAARVHRPRATAAARARVSATTRHVYADPTARPAARASAAVPVHSDFDETGNYTRKKSTSEFRDPWLDSLSADDVKAVAGYIKSLKK